MKQFIVLSLISLLFLCACKENKENFFEQAQSANLFIKKNEIKTISLDRFETYQQLDNFFDTIRDTAQNCVINYGLLYNYRDSNFVPSKKNNSNIIFPCFCLFANRCHVDMTPPSFIISLTDNKTIIIKQWEGETENYKSLSQFKKAIDLLYDTICNSDTSKLFGYIQIDITNNINIRNDFLPMFRTLLNAYKKNINKYLSIHNITFDDIKNLPWSESSKLTFKIRIEQQCPPPVFINSSNFEKHFDSLKNK